MMSFMQFLCPEVVEWLGSFSLYKLTIFITTPSQKIGSLIVKIHPENKKTKPPCITAEKESISSFHLYRKYFEAITFCTGHQAVGQTAAQ